MAIPRNILAVNALKEILDVDDLHVLFNPYDDTTTYSCTKKGYAPVRMKFDETTPLIDRITALRVAIRIEHGNSNQGEGSRPS